MLKLVAEWRQVETRLVRLLIVDGGDALEIADIFDMIKISVLSL